MNPRCNRKRRSEFRGRSGFLIGAVLLASVMRATGFEERPDGIHVSPGENIQEAIDRAASRSTNRVVKVHAGEYRPGARRQAMIWFNARHNGVVVEGLGSVTLTAANPEVARRSAP